MTSALNPEHLAYLEAHAVSAEVAERFGVRSINKPEELVNGPSSYGKYVPGILFPWRTVDGQQVNQYRPDNPPLDEAGRPKKYLFPTGSGSVIGVIREDDSDRVYFVEGTKQALAIADLIEVGSVYAIAGCRNWSSDGIPEADLALADGKEVILIFDADVSTNRDVWEAAKKFTAALTAEGATEVKYVIIPAGKTAGLDDVLGTRAPERRKTYLANLLNGADSKLPRQPKAPRRKSSPSGSGRFFDDNTGALLAATLARTVFEGSPLLLTREETIAVYRDGVYRIDKLGLLAVVSRLLGEEYRRGHFTTVEDKLAGVLSEKKLIAPDRMPDPMLNCANGMVDLTTGILKPWDPSFLSTVQIPVEFDPDAKCPTYEAWLNSQIPTQIDDLEETISQMLDPSRTPKKALFAYGPARSGKSTLLRIMEQVAGMDNVSGIPLHQLDEGGFGPASVYGKMLNAAADLSASEVKDLSVFKKMTGEDLIYANRKFGKVFFFTNRALFAFAANEVPQVSESSRAYRERVKPFKFGNSFAGNEDPSLEEAMVNEELPGILNRWVAANRRLRQRGHFLPTSGEVRHEFDIASDRVHQWVSEEMKIVTNHPDGRSVAPGMVLPAGYATGPRALFQKFAAWATQVGGLPLGEKRVLARLRSLDGVADVQVQPGPKDALNIVEKEGGSGGSGGHEPSSDGTYGTYEDIVADGENKKVGGREGEKHASSSQANGSQVSQVPSTNEEPCSAAQPRPVSSTPRSARPSSDKVGLDVEIGVQGAVSTGLLQDITSSSDSPTTRGSVGSAPTVVPGSRVAVDLESPSASELWRYGDGFIRLAGYRTGSAPTRVTTDVDELVEVIRSSETVIGHNVLGFDLLALAHHHGLDIHELVDQDRIVDTMLVAFLADPPRARMSAGKIVDVRSHRPDPLLLRNKSIGVIFDVTFSVGK